MARFLKIQDMKILNRIKQIWSEPNVIISTKNSLEPSLNTIKYDVSVSTNDKCTIKGLKSELVLHYADRCTIIGSDFDEGEHWIQSQNPFPGKVNEYNDWQYDGTIYIDSDMEDLFYSALQNLKDSPKIRLRISAYIKEIKKRQISTESTIKFEPEFIP
jgi:hypothetical protein